MKCKKTQFVSLEAPFIIQPQLLLQKTSILNMLSITICETTAQFICVYQHLISLFQQKERMVKPYEIRTKGKKKEEEQK